MANATAKNGFHESETQQNATYDHSKISTSTAKTNAFSSANNSEIIVVFRVFAIVIGLIGASFNGLVLRVLFTRRSRSQKLTPLIVNQIVLDFFSCVALFVTYASKIPVLVYLDNGWWQFFCFVFHTELLIYYFQQGSICNLVLIAVERNIFIVHQVTYRRYFRKWMVYTGVVLPWVLPIAYDIQVFIKGKLIDGQCIPGYGWANDTSAMVFTVCTFLSFIVIPLFTLIVCYGGIWHFVRRHKKVMHSNQARNRAAPAAAAAGSNPAPQKSRRQEMELVVTMLLISTMFFVSWTPNQVWLLAQYSNFQMEHSQVIYTFSILFVYLSACFNPFIYASKQESIRRGVLDILRKVRSKSGVQGTMSTTEAIQTISFAV